MDDRATRIKHLVIYIFLAVFFFISGLILTTSMGSSSFVFLIILGCIMIGFSTAYYMRYVRTDTTTRNYVPPSTIQLETGTTNATTVYPPPGYPPTGSYPPQQVTYHPQQAAYFPQQATYPPQQAAYPPQQLPYPPQQNAYPPQQNAYPPQQASYLPPAQPQSYPPGSGMVNEKSGYPPGNTTEMMPPPPSYDAVMAPPPSTQDTQPHQ